MSKQAVQDRVIEDQAEHWWKKRTITDNEEQRIQATIGMLPDGIRSILDVGCGDGRIPNRLGDRFQVVGVDYAYNSVKHLVRNGVRASSTDLPFPDKSFDLVQCCEVLEHLPEPIFTQTIAEIQRVARSYILISVPFRENLMNHQTQCQVCRTVFNIFGHVRSFSAHDLDDMFSKFRVNSTRFCGRRAPYYNQGVLYVNQTFGGRWVSFDETTVCPKCGNTKFQETGRNLVTILCGAINLVTAKLTPVSNKRWAIKLYSR